MQDEWPLVVALVTAGLVIAILRLRPSIDPRRTVWYVASDAVGLAAFVVVGTSVALEAGSSNFVAAVMGLITGVGGGVIRDVLARRTPIVLVGEIYAVAGLIGVVVQLALREVGSSAVTRLWAPVIVIVVVPAIAVRFSLRLPRLTRN